MLSNIQLVWHYQYNTFSEKKQDGNETKRTFFIKNLTFHTFYAKIKRKYFGALAQLGAHDTGSVGVRGSNPLCSTKKIRDFYSRIFLSKTEGLGMASIRIANCMELRLIRAWHQAIACISPSPFVLDSMPSMTDSIRHFVSIPCRNKLRISSTALP